MGLNKKLNMYKGIYPTIDDIVNNWEKSTILKKMTKCFDYGVVSALFSLFLFYNFIVIDCFIYNYSYNNICLCILNEII